VEETIFISGTSRFLTSLSFSALGGGDRRFLGGGCSTSSSEDAAADEISSSSESTADLDALGLTGFNRLYSKVSSSISNSGFVKASLNRSSSNKADSLTF